MAAESMVVGSESMVVGVDSVWRILAVATEYMVVEGVARQNTSMAPQDRWKASEERRDAG